MKSFARLWLPVIAWCGVIFYLSGIPNLRISPYWWDYPLRKAGHMFEYAVLALLFARAYAGSTAWSRQIIVRAALASVLVYAMSDEFHQHFVVGRAGTVRDVLIDLAGGWIGLFAVRKPRPGI